MSGSEAIGIPNALEDAVTEALTLLRSELPERNLSRVGSSDPLPSLLEQCRELACVDAEPVRLIHHFACTGGTLITKCLACVPNVHVLSEVDPLSPSAGSGGKFRPRDLSHLAENSNRPPTRGERIRLFMAGFDALYESNRGKGLRLVIRDHSHSHFCNGDSIPVRPSLGEVFAERFPVRSVVTVRHPVDSLLALHRNAWLHFTPATAEEYARRYAAFLDHYAKQAVFRYEDFVARPDETLAAICHAMDLPFPEGYRELFMVNTLSGDSGRKGDRIEARPRRPVAEELRAEMLRSDALEGLCRRLGYEWDV
mgnify:CR=1 FL=1